MAGTYSLPAVGEANSSADPKVLEVLKGYNETLNSSNDVEDSGLASPNNSAYRTINAAQQTIAIDQEAGTYLLGGVASTTGKATLSGGNILGGSITPFFYFASADYKVEGKTQKLRVRTQLAANATKPTLKFTVGLYPITVAGGTDEIKITLGTVVSGSTVEFNEPAASTVTSKETSDFTIPSDGAYLFGFVTSATLTNNAAVYLAAQLQTRSV